MRSVMKIGGSCGSGGAYVISHLCPQHVPGLLLTGIFGTLISLGLYGWLGFAFGPRLTTFLAWPVVFLSLGWNFVDFGFNPPTGDISVNWLFCAAGFLLIGSIPLFGILQKKGLLATFWSDEFPAPEPATSASPGTITLMTTPSPETTTLSPRTATPVGLKAYSLVLQLASLAFGVWVGVAAFRWIAG